MTGNDLAKLHVCLGVFVYMRVRVHCVHVRAHVCACVCARVILNVFACVILCRAPECDREHLHRTVDL